MAEKKKQHYVPKFLLRNFSWLPEKKLINIFNLRRKEIFKNGNLKDQCYEDYFYGKDLIAENLLGFVEGGASKIISDMIAGGICPARFSVEHETLLAFVLLQHARTKHKAESVNLQAEEIAKIALTREGKFSDKDLENISIRLVQPTDIPLSIAIDGLPLVYDLEIKILINETDKDFIICDNPVVYRNQFLYERTISSNIGLACQGLQIFLPISPRHVVILFDKNCYKLGKKNSDCVAILDDRDVVRLNHLQWLNVNENIYFGESVSSGELFRGHYEIEKYYSKLRPVINQEPEQDIGNGVFRTRLVMGTPEQKMPLSLSFIKQRKSMSPEEKNHEEPLVRDRELILALQEFKSLVKKKIYNPGQFRDYLNSKNTDYVMAWMASPGK
ncbi:DUF4238 domain-containing protein [Undibacterium sp. TC4M20W]|uniref:DUF4238 domain-containing protein n=1 Tax=unclassified Undibacterium TaxID=2630295 RepID=UPI003BEFD8D5